jgi:WD40 repeat protein
VDIFGNLSVYDPLTGKELYSVEMTGNSTYLSEERVCFVGNTQIAYPMENSLVIYNLESKKLREFENDWSSDLWADNNGDYLAVVDYEEMTIYETETMTSVFEVQLDSGESFQLEGEFSSEIPGLFAVEYNTLERACGFLLINVIEQTSVKIETPLRSITDIYFDENVIFYCGYFDVNASQGSLYCLDLMGNMKWEHSVDGLPDHILTFGAEKKDKIAYTKYGSMVVLYKEDGSVMAQEDLGGDITNYCGYVNSDYLTLMTREGSYYYYSPITEMATTYVGKFVTNSDNLKEFYFGNGYFVSVAYINNSAAVYQFSKGENLNLLIESDDTLLDSKMSPDGKYIVSEIYGTGCSKILISNVSDGSQVAEIVLEDFITDFNTNADGELVVLTPNSVEVYRLEDGTLLQKESTASENSRLINCGQAYVTYEDDKVYIKDVKSHKVLNEVAEKRIVKNGLFASTVDEMGEYYAFCDEDNKKIIIGNFAGDFSIEIPINVNAIKSLSLAPQAKAIFISYLDENVEAYDITTGNLLTSYGILEGGVEDVTELTNINCMVLKTISNAYLVNDQLEVIAFLQGYTDYCKKNDSFIFDDSYYVYEAKRRQLADLLNDAELYLTK